MLLVYLLQSDEAIQMALGYCLLYRSLRARGIDFKIVLWMHDEYQVECWPQDAAEVARLGCVAISHAAIKLGIPVPHEGDAKIGKNWMETH
jgi:DNA polymerase-1